MSKPTQKTRSEFTTIQDVHNYITQHVPFVLSLADTLEQPLSDHSEHTIVFIYDKQQYTHLNAKNQLPGHLPVLFIARTEQELPLPASSARLLDILTLPFSRKRLDAKITFLRNVGNIAREQHLQQQQHLRQLDFLSDYDGLTGLRNRRQFTRDIEQKFQQAVQHNGELCLLFFNIDFFAEINKTHSLAFGDFILNSLSARVINALSSNATCYRFSSDDFTILMPSGAIEEAIALAEKLRSICSDQPFKSRKHETTLSLSIGISSLCQHRPKTPSQLIFMAEDALFNAKSNGRNQAQVYNRNTGEIGLDHNVPLPVLRARLRKILDKTRCATLSTLQQFASGNWREGGDNHSTKITIYTTLLCKSLGLPDHIQTTFDNTARIFTSLRDILLQNLGHKPELLTQKELSLLEDMPLKIQELVESLDYFREERTLLIAQNENYDGSGFPNGLKGEEIPMGARLLKIADALAAMTSERYYRPKMSSSQIITELYNGAGRQFDPALTLHFLQVIDNNKLLDLDPEEFAQIKRKLQYKLPTLQL